MKEIIKPRKWIKRNKVSEYYKKLEEIESYIKEIENELYRVKIYLDIIKGEY